MADKIELLLEAERRGLLPEDKRAALAEARRRGLVPAAPVPMDPLQAPRVQKESGEYDHGQALMNMGRGLARGVEGTVQAAAQLAVRPPGAAVGAAITGQPNPLAGVQQSVDDSSRDRAAAFEASPAGQSVGGTVGQLVGAGVATMPLAALAIPVRGSSILGAARQGAVSGVAGGLAAPATSDAPFWQQKFDQSVTGALVGGGLAGGLRTGMAVAERVGYTPNALAQVANVANNRANRSAAAQEGEALSLRTGVGMTPGQVSGSRVQTSLENMSRQSIFSSDLAMAADEKIATDAIGYINRTMSGISRSPASAAQIGDRIQTAAKTSVAKITSKRDEVARRVFGPIEQALGERKFVDYANTRRVLDDLIEQHKTVPTPEADRIVEQATAMRDRLTNPHSLRQFQTMRGYYGRAVGGTNSVFDDVDRTVNQTVARRMYAAMSDDLDASAASLEQGIGIVPAGQASMRGVTQALREANNNYRRYSQLAEGVRAHPIARLFGKDIKVDGEDWFNTLAPEQVVARMRNMAPTEIRMVRQYMEGADAEGWQQYKRLLVQDALDIAQNLPSTAGTRQVPFNAGSFLRALGGDKPAKLRQLREVFSPEEMSQIDDAFSVARRLGDRFGSNPSGTGPYMEVQKFLDSVKQRSVEALASTGGEAMGLRKVANVMLDARGRRALIQLSKLPEGSKQAASLVAYLAALSAGQHAVKPDQSGNDRSGQQ